MKPIRLSTLPLAAFVLAACGGDRSAEYTEPGMEPMVPPPAAEAPGTEPAATGTMVSMNPVGESGVQGEMEVMAHGDQTMVMVTLQAPAEHSGTHAGHIHTGTCDAPGEAVLPLESITVTGGQGSASSNVSLPAAQVMDGRHIVAYHAAGVEGGAPVVCGAIPAESGVTSM